VEASELNAQTFEHRMSYLGKERPTSPHAGEIWRAVGGTNGTEQVSLHGHFRITTRERILAGKPGLSETRASPELVAAVFPLSEERLFESAN
jgi:hypothetical protein